jgi:hypothetical protein
MTVLAKDRLFYSCIHSDGMWCKWFWFGSDHLSISNMTGRAVDSLISKWLGITFWSIEKRALYRMHGTNPRLIFQGFNALFSMRSMAVYAKRIGLRDISFLKYWVAP